jgi:hypothetical protein
VTGLVRRDAVILLKHHHCRVWMVESEPVRGGEPEDAATDDDVPRHVHLPIAALMP